MDGATIVEREAPTSGFELAESGAVEEPNATWKSVNGHLCLIDRIPVSTGAGNKRWTYSMTPVIGSGAEWLVGQAVDRLVRLPNNRGKLDQFKILDMSGREPGSEGFSVGPGRTVLISIVGSDPDKDDWKIEVDRINRVVQDDFAFTNHASLSGKSRIVYEYSGNYDVLTIPVTLAYGDNNIQLAWSEGDAENDVRSEVRNLVVERDLEGIYRLTVLGEYGDRVACDEDGILCAPGQALTFAISAAGGEDTSRIKWDFGDGTPVETGPIQVHAYHQDQNQASCSLAREVALTLPTEPETIRRVRVIVMDTQIGELYETETWRGDHAVLGRIIVPEGMELHIASGQTVSFQGGSAAGSGQGLLVRPSARLIVDGGVVLKAPEAQSSRWDSIMVQGSAAIGAEAGGSTEIRDAERAVAAAPGSSVTLANVRLAANETGLHIVGSAAVGIDGCEIVGNFLYGIKEDSGGRPVLRNTTLRGNFRDYYSWNGGLLNAEQVNAMPGNAGNRGE
jgi:hypothetical protein